jgi:hypothetical protein
VSAADHLNPHQHKDFVYTRSVDEATSGTEFDEYKLIRRTSHKTGDVTHEQVGTLTVNRYPGTPERIGKPPHKEWDEDYDENWYRDSVTSKPITVKTPLRHGGEYDKPVGRQGRLFEYEEPTTPIHKVDLLTGTQEHRAANMTMLGMAENVARAAGTSLQTPEDLSRHSSRLIGRLQGMGAVPEEASTTVTNKMQFQKPLTLSTRRLAPHTLVPQRDVEAGRRTVREVIKSSRDRSSKRQGSLF